MNDSKSVGRSCLAFASIVATVGCILFPLGGTSAAFAADLPTTPTTGSLKISVVDADRKPLPEATLFVNVLTDEKAFKGNRDYKCDDHGQATVELPANLRMIRIWARHEHYAAMYAQLWPQSGKKAKPFPKEFTFALNNGTTMGGIVKNGEGQPVVGAKVQVQYGKGGDKFGEPKLTHYDNWLAYGSDAKVTDSTGRWQLDNVPPGEKVDVQVMLSHPDYINDAKWGALQKAQDITNQQLRDKSATFVMQRGYIVKGQITDADGKPLKNAVVIRGDRPYWEEGSQELRTDDQGNYHFEPLPAGPMRFTVAAQGWMPQMKKIEIAPGQPAVDFKLQPGKKLRIKIVDASGKPIPKAGVGVKSWRGAESLYTHRASNVINLQIPNAADKDGTYEWTWAPDDAVEFDFGQQGFATATASIAGDDKEHTQTLYPIFKITGTVTDAATGKPIEHFRVLPLIHFRPDFPYLERRNGKDGTAGKFTIEFDRTDIEHGVQIEAPGYVTFRTDRHYKVGEPNPVLDVRLQPAEPYRGTVVDADGKPINGAQVFVSTNFQQLDLVNLIDEDFRANFSVKTDQQGSFEIVPQVDRYALYIVSPAGFAQVEHAAKEPPGEVRVQPWALLKGHVIQDGKPMPKCEVFLYPIEFKGGDQPRMNVFQTATTDSDGSFTFERVPPVACRVRPFLHFAELSPLKSSRSLPLEIAPGDMTTVELGAGGAELTGQLTVDPPRTPFDYHFSLSWLVAKQPGINPPPALAAKGFDWHKGWSDSWLQSQEGQAYLNTLHNWFVKPDPDGKIRISGVPPGEYFLAINLYGTTEGCLVHPIAQRVVQISVPIDKPTVDLGEIKVPIQNALQLGDTAANFDFKSPDGKPTNLTAQRGHHVLIDFWATWCGPCVAHLPEVEALRKDFAAKGLVVVGANLDTDPAAANDFLTKHPLPWHHAQLGDWSASTVPKQFGITSVPAYILVDPQGHIAAIEYSADKIRDRLTAIEKQ